jgi:hypothetical protein
MAQKALFVAFCAGLAHGESADGFVGFIAGDCPPGWTPLSSAQGRLILAVNNSFQAGAAVGFPLSDGEDRAHTHSVAGQFEIPSRQVSAGCLITCNEDGAHSGKQPLLPFFNGTTASTSGFPFVQLTACRYNTVSFKPAPVLPIGGISLWDPASASSGCPADSAPLQQGSGRLLVLSNSSGTAVNPGVAPLEPGKDLEHEHPFSVSISLDSINYEGIHGCCNNDPAQNGVTTASGTASAASLSLPYIAMLACQVNASGAALALPDGMLFLTVDPSGCPADWAPSAFGGRALVATPSFGIPGKVFGGGSLITPANPYPSHAPHAFEVQVSLQAASIELVTGSGGDYGRREDFLASGSTTAAAVPTEQELPLIQVLACARSA